MGGGTGTNTKYGATVDTFLGDINSNGVLQRPTVRSDLVFDGVTDIAYQGLQYFAYNYGGINSASFPNMTQITNGYALHSAFEATLIKSVQFPVLQSITGDLALCRAFYNCELQSIEFPSLVSISGRKSLQSLCQLCRSRLMIASFPALKEITSDSACNSMFNGCSELTTVSLPLLEILTGSMALNGAFQNCDNLESVSFPKLKTIGSSTATSSNYGHFYRAFYNTPKITSLEFPELTSIYCTYSSASWGTFANNNKIQKLYFPKLSIIDKSPAYTAGNSIAQNNIFNGCSALTEIHFGAANQAAIEATEGYPTLWGIGAGNATVYFDL